jgi:hypothetical protein
LDEDTYASERETHTNRVESYQCGARNLKDLCNLSQLLHQPSNENRFMTPWDLKLPPPVVDDTEFC